MQSEINTLNVSGPDRMANILQTIISNTFFSKLIELFFQYVGLFSI